MRAVSTVLDVTVFLLVVSVAVAALALPGADVPAGRAGEAADTLATTTANATYRLAPAGLPAGPNRTVSGTNAGLLGRAALANLRLDDRVLAPAAGPFRAAVRSATNRSLDWSGARAGVVAVWRPYPGAPLAGRFAVGPVPPRGVDVSTATLSVPVPVEGIDAETAAAGGYDALGRAVADAVLDATLPRDATALPDPGSPSGRAARNRLAAYAAALDVDGGSDGYASRRARVASALADRLSADMRERFDSPDAAADAVRTDVARIVLGEWEP